MTKKSITFLSIFLVSAILIAGGVLWYANEVKKEAERVAIQVEEEQQKQEKKFVVDVDMNVENWQTKETEFFTIKFPKEWYWMESDREKTGYHSEVITNNPGFDMVKNAEIALSAGRVSAYPYVFIDSSEIIIAMRGWATTDSGTPRDFMRNIIKEKQPFGECYYISELNSIPLRGLCSYSHTGSEGNYQNIETYYISYADTTFAFTVFTTEDIFVKREVLDQIVSSIVLKE